MSKKPKDQESAPLSVKKSKGGLEDRVINTFMDCQSVSKTARALRMPIKLVVHHLEARGIEFKEEGGRQQINIRLSQEDTKKLNELREYWTSRRTVNFLHRKGVGTSGFDSNSALGRFVMETCLDYLYLDLMNEKHLEKTARWIYRERKNNQELSKKWNLLFPNWRKQKEQATAEWKSYEKLLEQLLKQKLKEETFDEYCQDEWGEENEALFNTTWRIAVEKSHLIKEEETLDKGVLIRTQILQDRYGDA